LLAELIQETHARLVIFDPFFAFLGPDAGSLNDLMIRRALEPFLLVRHLGKGSTGRGACYRGLGSMAILGAVRTAFLVARDPLDPDRRVLACTKNNLAAFPPALTFRILPTAEGRPRIDWLGPVERTADELVQAGGRRGQAVPLALDFLTDQLQGGWVNRQALLEQAQRAGIADRTLKRAKAQLGVLSQERRQDGQNVWYWALPGIA
jgi:hypothetical protein